MIGRIAICSPEARGVSRFGSWIRNRDMAFGAILATCSSSPASPRIPKLWAENRASLYKPGMRVTVGMIVEAMAAGRTIENLLADFPYLEGQDIREALAYAASLAQGRGSPLAS